MMHRARIRPAAHMIRLGAAAMAFGGALACSAAVAREQGPSPALALKKLTLDELMDIEVTSVSRTAEELHGAAAAIAVLTGEDIRRSGANSIPEALRLVPGLHVARIGASDWTVSARGFSSVNSEKLLVLSDTRSLYTPLFSGVFWDVQDYLMQDVERIEVIRGPGAALWGSNAVNGVINITTRNARDTQGAYLEAAAGNEDAAILGARYGGMLGDAFSFRVFGRHTERDSTINRTTTRTDDWRLSRAGFRADWRMSAADDVAFLGSAYRGEAGQFAPSIAVLGREEPTGALRTRLRGGNVLARWRRGLAEDSDVQLRFYYDRTHRDDPSFVDDLDTFDLDAQHRFELGPFFGADRHAVIWGLNYRHTDNENVGKGVFALTPASSADSVFSAFVQDQAPLGEAVQLTVGSKLEYNDFSGFELQPSVRAAWDIAPGRTLWGAVSRAARAPTRLERDIAVDASDPAGNPVIRLLGNEDFDSEELLAYELGFRWQVRADLLLDLATFHNRYDGLASLELGDPFVAADGRTIIPIVNRNLTDGEAHGIETLVTYAPFPRWRLTASHSYIDLELDPAGRDLNRGEFLEGATPKHQFGLRSSLDLGESIQLDVMFRRLSDIRSSPDIVTGAGVEGYSELDLRLAWRVLDRLELSLVGQNLLDDEHVEFGAPASRGAIERSVYGKLAWGF